MLYSYSHCLEKYGSPYRIERAIREGALFKMCPGCYSDTGRENELEIVQWAHPNAAFTLDSAYYYYDLTNEIPDRYCMATDRKARVITDPHVRQIYVPEGTFRIGLTTIDYSGDSIRTYDLERLLIETARFKKKLPPDLYKEVVLSFRKIVDRMSPMRIAEYLDHFPKKDRLESIIYEEVF